MWAMAAPAFQQAYTSAAISSGVIERLGLSSRVGQEPVMAAQMTRLFASSGMVCSLENAAGRLFFEAAPVPRARGVPAAIRNAASGKIAGICGRRAWFAAGNAARHPRRVKPDSIYKSGKVYE
jgi:hypothetical protein